MQRWRGLPPRVRSAFVASALSLGLVACALGFLAYLVYRSKASDAACSRHPGCFAEDPTIAYVMIFGTPLLVLMLWQLSATVSLTHGRGLASGTVVATVWVVIVGLAWVYSPTIAAFLSPTGLLNVAVIVSLWRARAALQQPAAQGAAPRRESAED